MLPQMREFVSKFTLEQIKENPVACEYELDQEKRDKNRATCQANE